MRTLLIFWNTYTFDLIGTRALEPLPICIPSPSLPPRLHLGTLLAFCHSTAYRQQTGTVVSSYQTGVPIADPQCGVILPDRRTHSRPALWCHPTRQCILISKHLTKYQLQIFFFKGLRKSICTCVNSLKRPRKHNGFHAKLFPRQTENEGMN